jgi:hypothetical protein
MAVEARCLRTRASTREATGAYRTLASTVVGAADGAKA